MQKLKNLNINIFLYLNLLNIINILFFNPNGKYLYDADRLHHHWKKLLKKCSIEHRAMYNIRHTYTTLIIKNEVPIHLVSQPMAHKTLKETLSTYAKFLPDENLKNE